MDITLKATRDDIWANILERLQWRTRSESPSGTPTFGERLQRRRAASTAPGDEQIGADPDRGRVLPGYLGGAAGRHHREQVDAVVDEWANGLLGEKVARAKRWPSRCANPRLRAPHRRLHSRRHQATRANAQPLLRNPLFLIMKIASTTKGSARDHSFPFFLSAITACGAVITPGC